MSYAIDNAPKDLVLSLIDPSDSSEVTSGTVAMHIRLELDGDADDGKYLDSSDTWQTTPGTYKAATHLQNGRWLAQIPASATNGKAGGWLFCFLQDSAHNPGTTDRVSSELEIPIHAEDPLASGDIPTAATITSTILDKATSSHVGAGTVGKAIGDAATQTVAATIAAAVWDATDSSYNTASTMGALLNAASQSGASAITIHTEDSGNSPIANTRISVYDSGNTTHLFTGVSDSNGDLDLNIDDGTYKLRLVRGGYTWTNVPETLTVSGDATHTFTASNAGPSAPSAPSNCTIFVTFLNASGTAIQSATLAAEIVRLPASASNNALAAGEVTATTDANGYAELELVQGAVVQVTLKESDGTVALKKRLQVPAAASQNLTTWA